MSTAAVILTAVLVVVCMVSFVLRRQTAPERTRRHR